MLLLTMKKRVSVEFISFLDTYDVSYLTVVLINLHISYILALDTSYIHLAAAAAKKKDDEKAAKAAASKKKEEEEAAKAATAKKNKEEEEAGEYQLLTDRINTISFHLPYSLYIHT